MPKVSIIMPVYNMEQYLKQCLESVINQTLTDIEIICVDDCSTDNSLPILNEYAKNDNRIKVIEQKENLGQGVARNIAMKQATGEYIGFVDPDDWVESNMYEVMYDKAKNNNAEIVFCDIVEFFENSTYTRILKPLDKIRKKDQSIQPENIFNFNNSQKYYMSYIIDFSWCKIYKRDLLLNYNIEFFSAKRSEDAIFCGLSNYLATRILYIEKPLYHYRQHRKTQFIKNSVLSGLCIDFINKFYKLKLTEDIKTGINMKLCGICMWEYKNIDSKQELRQLYKECANYIPYNAYKLFKYGVFINNLKQIPRRIFSTKNVYKSGKIYKYLYLLGLKIKLYEKQQNNAH